MRGLLRGESYDELCVQCKISHNTAYKLTFKAREQLQECVERATR